MVFGNDDDHPKIKHLCQQFLLTLRFNKIIDEIMFHSLQQSKSGEIGLSSPIVLGC